VPLPVRQHDLERAVGDGRLAGPVDERERLRGRQRGGRRRQHGVARLRLGERAARAPGLGEDGRPGRIPARLAQVHAARAGRPPGQHQRADHPDGLLRVHQQVRDAVVHELGQHHRVGPAGNHRQIWPAAAAVGGLDLARHPVDGPGDPG
jgi:hypothetical protein